MIDKDILKKAIETYGEKQQIDMIQEEAIELALAIQKLKRESFKDRETINVIDEIADVKIMLAQAEQIFDAKLINYRVAYKMNRLKKRLKEHDKNKLDRRND